MVEFWSENGPPVYVSAAAYLGLIKPKKKRSSQGKPAKEGHRGDDLNELLKMAGPGGMFH
jgi:hypothetical protein